jgi:hypothetical protein
VFLPRQEPPPKEHIPSFILTGRRSLLMYLNNGITKVHFLPQNSDQERFLNNIDMVLIRKSENKERVGFERNNFLFFYD